jgi:hypothetical protein
MAGPAFPVRKMFGIILPFFAIGLSALADERSSSRPQFVIPKIAAAPQMDGKVNESVWQKALRIDAFYQYTPNNGAPPSQKTEAYMYCDTHNLYVAFRCFDSEPDKIRATLAPRNQWSNNDNAFIYLDTFDNKRDQFLFMINPLGVQYNSFDTLWKSAGSIDSLGWSGEMAIPFKSLRFPNNSQQAWGFVLGRNIYRRGEILNSIDCRYDDDFYAMFPQVVGLGQVAHDHNIELVPYGAARRSMGIAAREQDAAMGIDGKLGLSSNLVLDVSAAPDFSQVESDPFFVNFSPYEYQLAENRPFFNEGSAVFSLPYNLFYSRRIENPKLMLKMTGKEGPWNLGVINSWDDPSSGQNRFYHAERLQKEVFNTSKMGFMISGFEAPHDYNRNISVDGQLIRGMNRRLQYQLATTFNALQDNKDNYLIYLQHSMAPYQGMNYGFNYVDIAPQYDPKTGIIGLRGYRNGGLSWGYSWHLPEAGIELLSMSASGQYSRVYNGLDLNRGGGLCLSCSFINRMNVALSVSQSAGRSQILRNEDLVWNDKMFTSNSYAISASSQTGSAIDGSVSYSYGHGGGIYLNDFQQQQAGSLKSAGLALIFKPLTNILFKNSTSWNKQVLSSNGFVQYDNWLFRNSLHYQISHNWFSRIVQDYDVTLKSQLFDFLLGYEFHAGSTFFVSYKELRRNVLHDPERQHYVIFSKFSYLFRI